MNSGKQSRAEYFVHAHRIRDTDTQYPFESSAVAGLNARVAVGRCFYSSSCIPPLGAGIYYTQKCSVQYTHPYKDMYAKVCNLSAIATFGVHRSTCHPRIGCWKRKGSAGRLDPPRGCMANRMHVSTNNLCHQMQVYPAASGPKGHCWKMEDAAFGGYAMLQCFRNCKFPQLHR